jgi:DNA uptake protein ComE-like DNA-binding protein
MATSSQIEELKEVKGIGDAMYNKIKNKIRVK